MTESTNKLKGFAAHLLGKGYEVAPAAKSMERDEWSRGWRLANDYCVAQQECIDAGLIEMTADGQAIWDPKRL